VFLEAVFDLAEYDPDEGLTLPELRVAMAPTVHPQQGWAMRFQSGRGLDLGYTADTGPSAELAGHFNEVGLLISEATEVSVDDDELFEQRGHLTAFEAGALARNSGARMLMLTHMWIEDDPERAVRDAATMYDGPITIAKPGLAVYL
jgi:ribonuclease BN (tRNA processing enzyme)